MIAREELQQKVYEALLESFKKAGPEKSREMSWFWRGRIARSKKPKNESIPVAA